MSGASFWFMSNRSQLNGLKCAFKLPGLHLEGKLESHSYPWDQAGVVLVTALKWKENVRLVFLSVIWTQLLGCACTSTSCGHGRRYKPSAIKSKVRRFSIKSNPVAILLSFKAA